MNPDNYSPELIELFAKNIILSNGGSLYPKPEMLFFDIVDEHGNASNQYVTSIHYIPGQKNCFYVWFFGHEGHVTEQDDITRLYRFIVSNYDYPDKGVSDLSVLKERLALREINMSFISPHGDFTQSDYEMIEAYQKFFSERLEKMGDHPVPMPGDIVEGAYYGGTHPFNDGVIESVPGWKKTLSFCAGPYVPFVTFADRKNERIALSVSGGPFFGIDPDDLVFVGQDSRLVCDWGHCGATACGAIDFPVTVNRWRIKDRVDY